MTKLKDILDTDKLEELVREKRINVQYHPTLPLSIYNYSNIAQFAGKWTNEERVCRGLIVDEYDDVIARGPSKFFNYGQPGAPEVALDEKVWVSRKEDGSLGISWVYDGQYGIATRGSFTSDQALKATEMMTERHKFITKARSDRGQTEIFEIVYPENRIVLDYKGESKLISLGYVDLNSGLIEGRNLGILYDGTNFGFDYEMTFAEALALPIPDDEEGYVIDIFNKDYATRGHIKLKGENYIRLHGAIFGLSERKIWEVFGQSLDGMNDFIAGLPDELQPWAIGVADRLQKEADELFFSVIWKYKEIQDEMGTLYELPRGDVAREFMKYPDLKGPLFYILDENPEAVRHWAYKQIKPAHKLFRTESEDTN